MKTYLTLENIKKLGERLKNIKNIELPKVNNEIKEAKKNGDLKENSDYQYSKKKKNLLEEEIKNIEYKISSSEIIKEENNFSIIIVKDLKNNKLLKYDKNNNDMIFLKSIKNIKIGDKIEINKYNKKKFFEVIYLKK